MDMQKIMERVKDDLRNVINSDLTPQEIIMYLTLMRVSIEGYLSILESFVKGETDLGDAADGR